VSAQSTAARPRRRSAPDRTGAVERAVRLVLLALIVAIVVYPMISVVSTSLSSQAEVSKSGGLVFFPLHPTLSAYVSIFRGGIVTRALVISVLLTLVGTALSLAVTAAMAYGLSRRSVVFSRPILRLVILALLVSPGIIPSYLLVKQLRLLDTYASLVLPNLVVAFNLIVLRNFFMNIPTEILESAHIDGAGDFGIFVRIVLPLSKGVMAVIALFYAVSYWNAFFNALLYLNNTTMWPLALILRLYVVQGTALPAGGVSTDNGVPPPVQSLEMAMVVVALVPILLVYPFLQRYFTRGVLTGAVKG
jgi:putative aldouronate transport system permease protein